MSRRFRFPNSLVTRTPALRQLPVAALPPNLAAPVRSFSTFYFRLSTFTLVTLLLASPAFAKKPRMPLTIVPWKELPAAVQSTIQTGAAGGKVDEVQKLTVNGVFIYCAEVKGADGKWTKVYTTEAGALMKVEPDNARNKRRHKPLFG